MVKTAMHCKELAVKEITNRLAKADNLIITSYKGLTSQNMNELRRLLRDASGDYFVVKDSMVKRALLDCQNKIITDLLEGEVGIVIDKKIDPAHISQVLIKFSKNHGVLEIRGGVLNGALISKQDIITLASLPPREVLLGIVACVLNAPIQGLAGALNNIICKLLYALNAVKDKRPPDVAAAQPVKEPAAGPQSEPEKSGENKVEEQK